MKKTLTNLAVSAVKLTLATGAGFAAYNVYSPYLDSTISQHLFALRMAGDYITYIKDLIVPPIGATILANYALRQGSLGLELAIGKRN